VELRYRVLPSLPGPDPGPASAGAVETHRGLDVAVRVGPGATIADLAEALATALGRVGEPASGTGPARSVTDADRRGPVPHPSQPVRVAAPRSGATVTLTGAPGGSPPADHPAPVRLLPVTDHHSAAVTLTYGCTSLRPGPHDALRARPGDDPDATAVLEVDRAVTVRTTGTTGRVELDGEPVLGAATVRHGQLLRVGPGLVTVVVDGELRPPETGPLRPHDGLAGEWPGPGDVADDAEPVALAAPPGRRRTPGFPWLSAAVPLVLGAGIWVVTDSLAVAGFVAASVAFVVAAALETRREARREHRSLVRAHQRQLDEAVRTVAERTEAWRVRSRTAHPGGIVVAGTRHRPRWSRHGASLDLSVRLGTTVGVAPVPVRLDEGGDEDLRRAASASIEAARTGPIDVVVDLARHRVLALVGDEAAVDALARSVVVELSGLVPPDELRVTGALGPRRRVAWDWLDWLPHARDDRTGRCHLVVVDGDDEPARSAGLGHLVAEGTVAVWLSRSDRGVPRGTTALVRCSGAPADEATGAELLRSGGPPLRLRPDGLGRRDAEAVARRWSAYRPLRWGATTEAPVSDLASLLGDDPAGDPERIVRRWSTPGPPGDAVSLAAPVGTGRGGVVVLDLAVDGPHALVAGTTGSGKSELVRTWLLATALCHPPTRVTFLLVDYKGGTAFAELDELPHSVGLVTDLDGRLGERVVASLRAELRRRERIERDGGPRPPALVVAVDEFATLARELPAFVDGVVDVAQRGRSLGIHLVLATQRPAGVVTDAIRANTSLRIAMRVADDDDSRDVVGTVAAAHLDRDRPGSGLVRVGAGPPRPVQVAWSTGPATAPTTPVRVTPLHGGGPAGDPPPGSPGSTAASQLSCAVRAAGDAAHRLGLEPPRRPWLPPLPHRVASERLADVHHPGPGAVVGLVDRPDLQTVRPLVLDLHRLGGVVVSGPTGTGRTTALATVAGAVSRLAPVRVHAVDRDGTLQRLLPTGCDVVGHSEPERTLRLFRTLLARGRADRPTLVLFDDADDWCRRHDRTNRGAAVDLLVRLCTDGPSLGLLVGVSTRRVADLPAAVVASLGGRLTLVDGATDGSARPAGRATVDGHVAQLAVPPERWAPATTPATQALPDLVRVGDLHEPRWPRLPVGLDADDSSTVAVDLRHRHLLVVGPPRSGRSSLLRLLAEQAAGSTTAPELLRVHGRDPSAGADLTEVATRLRQVLDRPRPVTPALLVVDDLDELFDLTLDVAAGAPTSTAFDTLLVEATRRVDAVRIVASASVDGVARSFAEAPRVLRAGRHGVLLACDPDVHPALLHTDVPRREEVPHRPGRGWLVGATDPVLVQFAVPDDPVSS